MLVFRAGVDVRCVVFGNCKVRLCLCFELVFGVRSGGWLTCDVFNSWEWYQVYVWSWCLVDGLFMFRAGVWEL